MMTGYDRILVLGASGFVGVHLLVALQRHWPNAELHATAHSHMLAKKDGRMVIWHSLDITSPNEIEQLCRQVAPDAIINLAAQSHVPTSFKKQRMTWDINLVGTLNLLEAIKKCCPEATLLQVGSSDVYGRSFQLGSVNEETPFAPLNPYAASKAAADIASGQYAASEKLRVIRARPFNHTGSGQREEFVLAAFAAQIARIEMGSQKNVLKTGNLEAERDFLAVEDVCSAYIELLERAASFSLGESFNIASGKSVKIRDMLTRLTSLSKLNINIEIDPERNRPADIPRVSADVNKILAATNWHAEVSHDHMLEKLLDSWRNKLSEMT